MTAAFVGRLLNLIGTRKHPTTHTAPPPAVVVRRPRPGRAELAAALDSQLKADQALWAPHLLTAADRATAARILRRYEP